MLGAKHLSGHKLSRLNVLSSLVSCILITGKSELRQMALGSAKRTQFASRVKQMKRWLLNEQVDYQTYYLPFVEPLLKALSVSGELVFSIDGSVVGKGCMALMFSVIYRGKAIPIVWKVYQAKKGHLPEQEHRELLNRLSKLVPQDCRIVIVGDGEFDGCDWQADILDQGWDYVLRTGKGVSIMEQENVFKLGWVCVQPDQSLFFEEVYFTAKRLMVNILVWQGKGFKAPLYLVTNLDYDKEIQRFYKKRFKIEPFFRDQKSKGFHIQRSGLRDPQRLAKLLIATCLAYTLSIMAGVKALQSKFYSEIARTDGQFLSLFQLGYRFLILLVDIRQWRTFSWIKDFPPEPKYLYESEICVPF